MLSSAQLVLALLLPLVKAAVGPVADLPITSADITPDGFTRPGILTGGTFPGVLITGSKGDHFQLNVQDQLSDNRMLESTSIHWHGLLQRGSAWADGPVGVTQCPIAPGNSFVYDFKATDQAGTFWYHSHYSTQYCDGLRGPFVVYDPEDPHRDLYDIDDESTVITLADWYHGLARDVKGTVPQADSILINGKGRWKDNVTAPLSVISVEPGKRYRFRLISISCDPQFDFSIDGHNMTIIEADGVNTVPYTVDKLTIFAGQRYSFILEANQPIGNYWARALPNVLKDSARFENGRNSAILRYQGANDTEPTTPEVDRTNILVESNLHPLVTTPALGNHELGTADVNMTLNLQFDFAKFMFNINGSSFIPPTVPVLLQILSGKHTAQELLPAGGVYTLPRNAVVELTIQALNIGGPHPIHLHGHTFQVIKSAGTDQLNWDNPISRDVVSSGVDGDIVIRFKTDNPGPWILHCHIDWHLELGLAVVFAEDVDAVASFDPPPSWDALCPTYDALPSDQL